MGTELRLVKDGKTLYSIPVESFQEEGEGLQLDVGEEELAKLVELYSMAANEQRLKMMLELARRGEMRFSDFLKLSTNPKLVKTCVDEMTDAGLLEPRDERDSYRPSERGSALLITMTTGLVKLLEALEEEE